MHAHTEQLTNTLTAQSPLIELQTENGFSILRRWEIDGKRPPNDTVYTFDVGSRQVRNGIWQISSGKKVDFPVDNRLTITELDREDVMLTLRWVLVTTI